MSKYLLLILVTFTCFQIEAQKLKAKWGPNLKIESKYYNPSLVGEDESFLYVVDWISRGGSDLVFQKIDKKSLKLVFNKKIKIPREEDFRFTYEGLSFIDGKLIVFASFFNDDKMLSILKAFVFDSKSGEFTVSKLLFENVIDKRSLIGDFKILNSKNGELVLVSYIGINRRLGQALQELKLIDGNLESIIEKSENIDGETLKGSASYFIDDEGSIYFKRGNRIVILDVNQDYEEWSQEIKLEEIELGAYISDFSFRFNANNDLIITGSYYTVDGENNEENKSKWERKEGDVQVEGMFYLEIDGITKETTISKLSRFEIDFIDQFKTEKDIKKGWNSEINGISARGKSIFKEDGGLIFISEKKKVVQSTDKNTGKLSGENIYFSDLIVLNFTPDGELIWASRIPKNQMFYWRGGIIFNRGSFGKSFWGFPRHTINHFSFLLGLTNDKLYLIFSDHVKNVSKRNDYDELEKMKKIGKSIPVVYTVDLKTGHKSKEVNLSFSNGIQRIWPKTSLQSGTNQPLYIFGQWEQGFSYGKVIFKKR